MENFEKSRESAWIVRIGLNKLMPFYIKYLLQILEDEFVKSKQKSVFKEFHNKNV